MRRGHKYYLAIAGMPNRYERSRVGDGDWLCAAYRQIASPLEARCARDAHHDRRFCGINY